MKPRDPPVFRVFRDQQFFLGWAMFLVGNRVVLLPDRQSSAFRSSPSDAVLPLEELATSRRPVAAPPVGVPAAEEGPPLVWPRPLRRQESAPLAALAQRGSLAEAEASACGRGRRHSRWAAGKGWFLERRLYSSICLLKYQHWSRSLKWNSRTKRKTVSYNLATTFFVKSRV